MKNSTFIIFATMLLCIVCGVKKGRAQTYRVTTGIDSNGARNYREVYEYDFVSDKPEFPGGDCKLVEYINSNRRYPKEEYRKGVCGKVTCSFVVNTDGRVSHVHVLRSVHPKLDEEAVRILASMPVWSPGKLNGQAVPVRVIWSVPFRR